MEQKLDLAVLRANMLFRNLSDEEVLSVIDTMSPRTMKYQKRTVVARDGDEFPEIGVILSGSVHLFHIDSNGNSNLMDVLGAGDTLGELSAVGRYRLHVTVTATAQTEILFLSVERLLRKNVLTAPTQIRFLQNLTLAVAKKGQYLTRKLEDSIRRSTFLGTRENRYAYKGLFVLNALAITLHPYFVPMTYGVTFALVAGCAWRQRRLARPAAFLAADLAATLLAGWLFGTFSAAGSGAGGAGNEYGYFSMNLNALWNPTSRGVVWSLFLPVQNQVGGNYDGFNYLGLGVLLALLAVAAFAVFCLRRRLPELARRHGWLLFVCACLTVFAVSHVVTANGATLFRFPLPQALVELATTLRSSGRLFWPVYYLLMLAAVAGLARLAGRLRFHGAAAGALALLCLVQLADLSPALAQKAASLRSYVPCETDWATGTTPALCETTDFFEAVRGRYANLLALDPLTRTGMELALWAADEGMNTTDTSVVARYNEALAAQSRQDFWEEVLAGKLRADSLYLTERPETFLQLADAASEQGAWCGALYALPAGADDAEPVLYVIAPGLDNYAHPLATEYSEDFPLRLADYSDDYWYMGVLSLNLSDIGREADENKVVLFYDTPLARRRLKAGSALCCEGVRCSILEVDDSDAGWLMVTLETEDARALAGKDLVVE